MGTYVKKNGQLEEIAPVYTAGTGIEIQDNVVKAVPYTAGEGIEIQNNVVKAVPYTAGPGIEIQNNVVKAVPYTAGNNISINENKEISCDISTMNFKGTVATYEQLPTNGQDVGDVWNISSTNTNYCWNGSNWITIGSSVDISGLMNKDGSNAAFPEHQGPISFLSTMLINGGNGFKTSKIQDIKSNCFPVDKILSKTSENPVQNKVITANMFVVFASETYYANVEFRLPQEIPMERGVRIKFVQDKFEMLINDLDNNFTINGRNVYVNKNGTPIFMPAHTVNNVELCVMQIYAAVEMVYLPELGVNGGWLVLGNPEVISYSSDTVSYTVYADGLIEQEIIYTGDSGYINLPVHYSNENYKVVGSVANNSSNRSYCLVRPYSNSQLYYYNNIRGSDSRTDTSTCHYFCKGY